MRPITRLVVAIVLFAIVHTPLTARALAVEEVPNPQDSGSFVTDSGSVLGPNYTTLIDGIARELRSKTSAELAVVTVSDLDGLPIEDYAVKLFQRFGIGQKGKDNGLLILFSRDDRKVRIEVGYGLEGILPDAKTGRLLDTFAIPRFKEGAYGRGLYDTAKNVAITAAQTTPLAITDPETWPEQPVVETAALAAEPEATAPAIPFATQMILYIGILGGIVIIWLGTVMLRVRFLQAKSAKQKVLSGGGNGLIIFTWVVGGFALFMLAAANERVFAPVLAYIAITVSTTLANLVIRKRLTRYVDHYTRTCATCGRPMELIGEREDDRYLTGEEIAEEQAGGMNYEFWHCTPCNRLDRLNVKLGGAEKCERCRRRTLVSESTVLESATTSHSGRMQIVHTCRNPRCGYRWEEVRRIPRVSSSSSSSSSFGSSSSSFGGGSSGGGGASRGW